MRWSPIEASPPPTSALDSIPGRWQVRATIRQPYSGWSTDRKIPAFNNRMTRKYAVVARISLAIFAVTNAVDPRKGRILASSPSSDAALEVHRRIKDVALIHAAFSSATVFPEESVKPGAFQCGEN